jgi:hypothetical protein
MTSELAPLRPNESALVGQWVRSGGTVKADGVSERIEWLTREVLEPLANGRRVGKLAALYLSGQLAFKEFLSSVPAEPLTDDVSELIDLIEHEPKKGGVFGVTVQEHDQYMVRIRGLVDSLLGAKRSPSGDLSQGVQLPQPRLPMIPTRAVLVHNPQPCNNSATSDERASPLVHADINVIARLTYESVPFQRVTALAA